jgi:hypothetical protein
MTHCKNHAPIGVCKFPIASVVHSYDVTDMCDDSWYMWCLNEIYYSLITVLIKLITDSKFTINLKSNLMNYRAQHGGNMTGLCEYDWCVQVSACFLAVQSYDVIGMAGHDS